MSQCMMVADALRTSLHGSAATPQTGRGHFSALTTMGGGSQKLHGALRCGGRSRGRAGVVSIVSQFKDVSPTGQNMEKVQRVIGMANADEKKSRFGPAPPSDREAGSGFINLSGREDLLMGARDFNRATDEMRDVPSSSGPPPPPERSADRDMAGKEASGSEKSELEGGGRGERGKGVFLPTPLTPGQRIIALGMLALTATAFGRSSQDVLPADILDFLQVWMQFAWAAHAGLGVIAAVVASGKGLPPQKWFVKVLCTGALGLQEILAI